MNNLFWSVFEFNFWRKSFQKIFLWVVLAGIYIPLICFILLSFNSPSTKNTVSTKIGNWNGVQNYVDFFTNSTENHSLSVALKNSLTIAFVSIPISLFIGLLTTISIWKNYGKGQKATFTCCNITISCPDIIQAIAFSLLFSTLVLPLGFFSVILTYIALQIPYVVIILYPKLNKLNINLLLASYDLNFKFFESLVNVIIPALFPNIIAATITIFTISFDDYIITNLIRGNITTVSTELYSMKTGIKVWASVFGSLFIVLVTLISLFVSFYRNLGKKR